MHYEYITCVAYVMLFNTLWFYYFLGVTMSKYKENEKKPHHLDQERNVAINDLRTLAFEQLKKYNMLLEEGFEINGTYKEISIVDENLSGYTTKSKIAMINQVLEEKEKSEKV